MKIITVETLQGYNYEELGVVTGSTHKEHSGWRTQIIHLHDGESPQPGHAAYG